MDTIETFINFVQSYFPSEKVIPLHRPVISEKDKALVTDALNPTYVSSVGKYVELFENKICEFTGSEAAVAVVNGTAALHTYFTSQDVSLLFLHNHHFCSDSKCG